MRFHCQKWISNIILLFFLLACVVLCVSGCSEEIKPVFQKNSLGNKKADEIENAEVSVKEEFVEEIKNDEIVLTSFDRISDYLWQQAKETYSPYYQLLGFKISNYKENTNVDSVEAVLNMTVFHKNYDKDPDTVAYIKEAKEKNDPNYQRYYDDYLATQEMNMEIKAIIKEDGQIILYMDADPTVMREWNEFHMSETIMK